jgi:Fe-S-cluster containining protein
MAITEFECRQCGRCCMGYGGMLTATHDDVKRWREEGRSDILRTAKMVWKGGNLEYAELWFDPTTGKELFNCPWLKREGDKASCSIHETRPQVCRSYFCKRHVKGKE